MSLIDKYTAMNSMDPNIALREEVKNILRDYRNFWDIYAETLQNSIDSINRRYRLLNDSSYYLYNKFKEENPSFEEHNYVGKISIEIDIKNSKIIIRDNGTGIKHENIDEILLPKCSGKKMSQDYGFKGYGLTFVAFISREFLIKSKYFTGNNTNKYEINGLFDWVTNDSLEFPTANNTSDEINEWNTVIQLRLDDNYETRFDAVAALDLSKDILKSKEDLERFEYILRTKTAIGNTKRLFSKPPIVPIDVRLKVIFSDDSIEERNIPYEYYHPSIHEEISVDKYEFANYVTQMQSANFTRGFRGLTHPVLNQNIGSRLPINCDIYIAAISSTRLGKIEEDLGLSEILDPGAKISCGIYLSINGMPTGIRLDSWDKKGGSFKRYYVIVDCDMDISNTLDSGRKGITSHYARLIDEKVQNLINTTRINNSDTFASYASRDLNIGRGNGEAGVTNSSFLNDVNSSKEQINIDKNNSVDLVEKVQKLSPLCGLPHSEQEVIVLFYSLLVNKIIKGYNIVYQAGSEKIYDASLTYNLELKIENIEPTDCIGIGRINASNFKKAGKDTYNHSDAFIGVTALPELCVEFKKTVGGLLCELSKQTNKEENIIDLLIVWDTSIPSQVDSTSYTLSEIRDSSRLFHGTTHRLGLLGSRNTDIEVICLKDILEKIN